VESCDPGSQRCTALDDGSRAYCADGCKPGSKVCVLNGVGSCYDDGSLPKSGTPCASNERCQNGECKALGCEVLGIGQACADLPCVPGETGCVLDQVGTCAADGKSLSQLTEDCRAEGNVCTADWKCAKSFIDIIPAGASADVVPADTLVADVITVRTPRKLIELQTWLPSASTTRQMHWLAYELVGNTFVAKADKLVSDLASTEYHSSGFGSFSYQLEAGKTYLLGLVVEGASLARPSLSGSYAAQLSFGVLQGRLRAPYAPTIELDAMTDVRFDIVSHLRVTTEAP
jgi:hypothetical protein